jgi:conserved oligomeric Golgi complex subunit 2
VKEKLVGARSDLAGRADSLKEGLSRRQSIAAARATLALMQDASHAATKIDKLLTEVDASTVHIDDNNSSKMDDESLEGRCRLLDRVCGEVSRLHFFAAKGEDLAFMKALEPRMEGAAERLQTALDSALASVLKTQNPQALTTCLHAYASLGRPAAAEVVVRREVVAPIVMATIQQTITTTKDSNEGGSSNSTATVAAQTLPRVLDTLKTTIIKECGSFLELALSAGGPAFNFLGTSVVEEIEAGMQSKLAGAPSPGIPDAFCASYNSALALLAALEELCASAAQVTAFRSSTCYKAFLKKWNLPAYFSLRMQEIGGAVEVGLSDILPTNTKSDDKAFMFTQTQVVWDELERCTASNIFLKPLSDKFSRLSMQLGGARYARWIEDSLKHNKGNSGSGDGDTMDSNNNDGEAGRGEDQGSATQPTVTTTTSLTSSQEQLVNLYCDVEKLNTAIHTIFLPKLTSLLLTNDDDDDDDEQQDAVKGALSLGFSEVSITLKSAQETVLQHIAHQIAGECLSVLTQLRGIVATFRMTARAAPTRPSHYASLVLQPLQKNIQQKMNVQLKSSDDGGGSAVGKVSELVVAEVAERFAALAGDTLSAVRKTESSLRRLKTRKAGGGGTDDQPEAAAAAALSTDQLIAMQLNLDAREFGKHAKAAGVNVQHLKQYQSLMKAVALD